MNFPQVIARYMTSAKSDRSKDDLDLAVFVQEVLETEDSLDEHWRRVMNMAHSYIVTKHPRTRVRFKKKLNSLTEPFKEVLPTAIKSLKSHEQAYSIDREMELFARIKDPKLLVKDVFLEDIESSPEVVTISDEVTYTQERYNEHEQKIRDPRRFRKGS